MAERAHEIPAKYGDVLELFHPRMRSYGRRIEAALPGTITLSNVVAKLKYRSFPSMWALDKQGKSLLRLDGRVWDAKTMSTVASKLSDQTTVYKKANVLDIDRLHHGLITFTELHPGWKSATMAILAVLIVVILGGAAILPEDMARSIHLIP